MGEPVLTQEDIDRILILADLDEATEDRAPNRATLRGPDGLTHSYGYNPATRQYDIDYGITSAVPRESSGPAPLRVPEGLRTESELIERGAKLQGFDYVLDVGNGYVQRFYQDEDHPGRYRSSAPTRPAGATGARPRSDTISIGTAATSKIGAPTYDTNLIGADVPGIPTTAKVTIEDLINYTLAREGIQATGTSEDLQLVTTLSQANNSRNIQMLQGLGVAADQDPLVNEARASVLMREASDPRSKLGGAVRGGTFGKAEAEATKYAYRPNIRTRERFIEPMARSEERTADFLGQYGEVSHARGPDSRGVVDEANAYIERLNEINSAMDLYAEGGHIVTNDPLAIVNMRTKRMIGMTSEFGQKEKTSWEDGEITIDPLTVGFAVGGTVTDQIAVLQNKKIDLEERYSGARLAQELATIDAQIAALQNQAALPDPIDTLPGTEVTPGTPAPEQASSYDDPFAAIAGTSTDTAEAAFLAANRRRLGSQDYIYTDYAGLATPDIVTLPFSALGLGMGGGDGTEEESGGGITRGLTPQQADLVLNMGYGFRNEDVRGKTNKDILADMFRAQNAAAKGGDDGSNFLNIKNLPQIPGIRFEYPNIGAEISAIQARLLTTPVDVYHTEEIAAMKNAISKLRDAQLKAYPWINRPPPLNQPTLAEDPLALLAGVGKGKKKSDD